MTNTFPFNQRGGHDEHHGDHHGDHHGNHQSDSREGKQSFGRGDFRQSDDGLVSFDDVAGARPGNDGRRCIDKVEVVEETEYDEVEQCDHSYDKR